MQNVSILSHLEGRQNEVDLRLRGGGHLGSSIQTQLLPGFHRRTSQEVYHFRARHWYARVRAQGSRGHHPCHNLRGRGETR
jgi:hypothetical protein